VRSIDGTIKGLPKRERMSENESENRDRKKLKNVIDKYLI